MNTLDFLMLLFSFLAFVFSLIAILQSKAVEEYMWKALKEKCWRAQQNISLRPVEFRVIEPSGTYSNGEEIVDESSKNEQL